MAINEVAQNGWTAVPVDAGKIFKNGPFINRPESLLASEIVFPSADPVVAEVQDYAKKHLQRQTFHHSMRVFYFGKLHALDHINVGQKSV